MTTWPAISAGMRWLARLHDDLRSAPAPPEAAHPPMANHLETGAVVGPTLSTPLGPAERTARPDAILRTPLTFRRDLAYLGPSSRPELLALRGRQYEWALRLLRTPGWRTAFS